MFYFMFWRFAGLLPLSYSVPLPEILSEPKNVGNSGLQFEVKGNFLYYPFQTKYFLQKNFSASPEILSFIPLKREMLVKLDIAS